VRPPLGARSKSHGVGCQANGLSSQKAAARTTGDIGGSDASGYDFEDFEPKKRRKGGNRKPGDPCGRSASSPRERKPFLPIVVHETLELVDPGSVPDAQAFRPPGGWDFPDGFIAISKWHGTRYRCEVLSKISEIGASPLFRVMHADGTGRRVHAHSRTPRGALRGRVGAGCLVQSKRA
jgi:hypothetical protein